MGDNISDNKRIAKNTIYLYFRMFLMMAVGLYTSRVVLNVLGVSDYGLNNAVSGAVYLFSFMNASIAQSTQRFLNFSLGTGSIENSKNVFSTAIFIHAIFAAIVFIFAECIGLYLLQNKMTIDAGRMNAALVLFQLSAIDMFIGIVMAPFSGCIIAHEKMGFYAYTSILSAVFRLVMVFLLLFVGNVDKLILYGSFNFLVGQIFAVINLMYCRKNFSECRFSIKSIDHSLQKEMLSFSGWGLLGNMAAVGSNQGVNILLNMFYNTTVNAARGIANNVLGHIQTFITNFQTAVNPQIVKLYASGDAQGMYRLANNTSRYSAYLFLLLAIPIFLEIDYVLYLWLGIVPNYTSFFAKVSIIQGLIVCMDRPHVTAIHATGFIKWLHIIVGGVLLLIVPMTYILLSAHISLEVIYVVNVIPWAIGSMIRLELLRYYAHINPMDAYRTVYLKVFYILLLCFIPSFFLHASMEYGLNRFLAVSFFSFVWSGNIIYWIGLSKNVRKILVDRVVSKFISKE